MEPQPTMGRIVRYNHPGDRTGKFPPKQSPAIILHVHDDGACDIRVFTAPTWIDGECVSGGGEYINLRTRQGDGPLQWQWPPRD